MYNRLLNNNFLEFLYIEATEKLKILSVDQALKLKLNRKPELFKIKACLYSFTMKTYPMCEEPGCKAKKLIVREQQSNEYFCNNFTSSGLCTFRTTSPKFNNILELNLVDCLDKLGSQIPASAIGKIADALIEKIKTFTDFVFTVRAHVTEFQV